MIVVQYLVFGKAVNRIFQIQKLKIKQLISQEVVHLLNHAYKLIIPLKIDSTEKTNLHEQWEPSPAPTSHYNLRCENNEKEILNSRNITHGTGCYYHPTIVENTINSHKGRSTVPSR